MSVKLKRKSLVFLGLVLSLSTAMFVNWYYTGHANTEKIQTETTTAVVHNLGDAQFVNAEATEEYFSSVLLERTKSQEESKKMLKELLENSEIDEVSKQEAEKAYERLADNIRLQTDIESLIKAKCSSNAVVCLSDTAEVIVPKGVITDELCIQIKDIVTKKSKISEEKITIIEAK
ncbi:MAG: SpoIIIAH-like family protein [Clostridia bacterium]|nr:SpoIIIAH-like family protein [Clostridia bacterium]